VFVDEKYSFVHTVILVASITVLRIAIISTANIIHDQDHIRSETIYKDSGTWYGFSTILNLFELR
jgi:allantoicase